MSAVEFEPPLYKAFGPTYPAQRPIIVDEALESPDTVTLRYEEEAVGGERGGLRGDSPSFLPMATYKHQPAQLRNSTTFSQPAYSQYAQPPFSNAQNDNAAAHMNQLAYINNEPGQYLPTQENGSSEISVLSFHPTAGGCGTKVAFKMSSKYDLETMAGGCPYASVYFGSRRIAGHLARDAKSSSDSCGRAFYTVSIDVPPFMSTGCASPEGVPMTLVIEGGNGSELCRVQDSGVFAYHDVVGSPAAGGASTGDASPPEELTRRTTSESPEQRDSSSSTPPQSLGPVSTTTATSPPGSYHGDHPATTNSYTYPGAVAAETRAENQTPPVPTPTQPATFGSGYTQDANSMLGAYRGGASSYRDQQHRTRGAPPLLRSSRSSTTTTTTTSWGPYGSAIDTIRSPATTVPSSGGGSRSNGTSITRPGISSLRRPSSSTAPQLIRTSTLSTPPGGNGYNPYAVFPAKATLKINGDLEGVAQNWTPEEWDNRRRIVLFRKSQHGSQLQTSFRAVPVGERPPNSTCISCIWWAERQECFVTSVDTIYLLEQLVAAPARFTVEEKNRIRRNLEGFHPLTVSKAKAESADFFRVIMSFGNPKPRNIEKDVKVFPWKILGPALKKIISKYSASPATTTSYPSLPPTPVTNPTTAAGYIPSIHHTVQSPRPLPSSSWAPYPNSPYRTLSPGQKSIQSPAPPSVRIPSLQSCLPSSLPSSLPPSLPSSLPSYDGRPYLNHRQNPYGPPVPATQDGRWDGYTTTTAYPSHPTYATHDPTYPYVQRV